MANQRPLLVASAVALLARAQQVMPADWFGYNIGDAGAKCATCWSDAAFQSAVAGLSPSTIRFPSGTGGNYWIWKQGCEQPCNKGATMLLADFKKTFDASGATAVVWVLNMLTDTLASQLDMLAAADALGLGVRYVELGNEFYNNEADYVAAFPTGSDYGAECTKWIAALRAAYPSVAVSVVAVPSYRTGKQPRLDKWNDLLFAAVSGLRAGDGATMHEYDASGAGQGATFTQADVAVMLGTPFATAARIGATAGLPAGVSIWVTEFNLLYHGSGDVPCFGTWASGLYVALEALLLLGEPLVASGRVNKHCLFTDAYAGMLFDSATAFDFVLSPDRKLATALYGYSAAAYAMSLLGNATAGATSTAAVALSPAPPPVKPRGGGAQYPSVVGRTFSGGGAAPTAELLMNLGGAAYDVSQSDLLSFASYAQVSAHDATAAVNKASVLTRAAGPVPASKLSLPGYSVTLLKA